MPPRDPATRLRHILDHAKEAVAMAEGKSRADLDRDRQLNLALVRLLEIIGEAASHIPEEIRASHPHVPWAQIVSLRNRLIHGYDAVDFDVLWKILSPDLPPLIAALEKAAPPHPGV
jgi:uncharacterized protein with HEPN domain